MTCRYISHRRRKRDLDFYPVSKDWELPVYCPIGIRHEGGVTLGRASISNTGTCRSDVKGEIQATSRREDLSTDAEHRGGDARSSDEALVMRVEQRGVVVWQCYISNPQGEDFCGQSETVLYSEVGCMGSIQASEGESRSGRS